MLFKKRNLLRIDVTIENMCCARCAAKVEGWLNLLDGVSAEVNFKKGKAVLLCKQDVPDSAIRGAVEQTDYYRVREIIRR